MAASDAITAAAPMLDVRTRAIAYLATRHRLRLWETLPWLIAVAAYFIFPDRMVFGSQVLVMVLFALSLDLILGFAGIVSLGHAAFFGIGAYAAALLTQRWSWQEAISGLIFAAAGAGGGGAALRP